MLVSPRLAPAVIGLLLALLYGCGGPLQTVGTANPMLAGPWLGLTFEPATAATARLGPAGGELEATGSDGTRYTLTIPPDALLEEVDITLTPVAVAGLPVSGRTLGAVHFAPEGLRLLTPATLTVRPVLPVDPRRFVAVGFHAEGTQLFVAPARANAQELVISVLHFSGAAAAEATPQETQALGNLPQSSASQAAQNQIGVTLAQSVQDTGSFSDEAIGHCEQVLRDYFEASVIGPLQQAASDQALEAALGEFAFWKGLVSHTEFLAGSARQLNEAEERRGTEAARAGLQAAVRRVNDRIEQTGDWRVADEMLRWNGYAQAFGLDTPADGLDLVTIERDLAVQIDLGPITFPSSLDNTESVRLEATAGLKIRNRPTSYADPVAIAISLQGADPAAGAGDTDSQGEFALEPIRLSGGSTAIDARVEARFPRLSLPLFAVKTAHCDGVVDLDFTGPGGLQLGGTGTYTAVVRKGLGVAMGSWVAFSQQGPGSLNPTSARTSDLGLVQTAFQAPTNAGQTELTLEFTDAEDPDQPVYTRSLTVQYPSGGSGGIIEGNWGGTHTALLAADGSVSAPAGPVRLRVDDLGNGTADISMLLEFPPPGPPYGGDPLTISRGDATLQGGSLTITDAQVQGGYGFEVARADVTASVSPDGQTMTGSITMRKVPGATYHGATTTFTMSRLR